jgi:hypothetical protein
MILLSLDSLFKVSSVQYIKPIEPYHFWTSLMVLDGPFQLYKWHIYVYSTTRTYIPTINLARLIFILYIYMLLTKCFLFQVCLAHCSIPLDW